MEPDDRQRRIAALERELEALRRSRGDEEVQVVEHPHEADDTRRIAALDRRLEDLEETIDEVRSVVPVGDPRPAIQVIQRTEVDTGKKKREPTPAEERAQQVMSWGCAIAMVLWAAWCFSLAAVAAP